MDFRFEAKDSKSEQHVFLNIWVNSDKVSSLSYANRLKLSFFKVYTYLYPQFDQKNNDKPVKSTLSIICLLLETLVLVTYIQSDLAWINTHSDTYRTIWEYFCYMRLERLCGIINIFEAWLVFNFLLIFIPLLGLGYFIVLAYFGKEPLSKYLRATVLIGFTLADQIFMVSIASTLVGMLKYGAFSSEMLIPEFNYDLSRTGRFMFIGAMLMLPIQFTLLISNKLFMTETRHDLSKYVGFAKASSKLDILKVCIIHLILISNYFLGKNIIWAHYLICIGLSSVGWYSYLVCHPFYRQIFNSIYSNQFTIIATVSFSHAVGYFQNNDNITLLLSLLLTPLTVILSHSYMIKRYSSIVSTLKQNSEIFTDRDCEILLRDYILQKNPETLEIIKNLYLNPIVRFSKLLAILDSYFTCNVLKDRRLARIKLNLNSPANTTLEIEYAVYRCRKFIENDESCETLRYMKFKILYNELMSRDQQLCEYLRQIWSHLCLDKPSSKLIRLKVIEIKGMLHKVKSMYLDLISKYPSVNYLYKYYGLLLDEILNDSLNGQLYLHKATQIKSEIERTANLNPLSLFHPNVSVIIVSGNPDYFGRVLYSNTNAQELLEFTASNMLGICFTDLIPEHYKIYHIQHFRNFLTQRKQTEINTHSNVLHLSNYQGFIIPVKCLMKIDALGTFPCMLISFVRYKHNIQIALLSDSGNIMSHSKEFCLRLALRESQITNQNLYSFIPEIKNKFLLPLDLKYGFKIILLKYQYCSKLVDLAVIYKKFEEIHDLDATHIPTHEVENIQTKLTVSPKITTERSRRGVTILIDPSVKYYSSKVDSNSLNEFEIFSKVQSLSQDNLKILQDDRIPRRSSRNARHLSIGSSKSSRNGFFELTHKRFMANVKKKTNNLKIVIGLTILSLILANIAITVVLSQAVSISLEIGKLEESLNLLKLNIYSMRNHARSLDFNTRQNITQYDTQDILSKIQLSSDLLQSTSEEINDLKDQFNINEIYEQVFLNENILVWNLINDSQFSRKVNFMDLLDLYIAHSHSILISDPQDLNVNDPSVYFLFKNSYSDAIKYCNVTLNSLESAEKEFILSKRMELLYTVIGVLAIIIITSGLISYRINQVQKSSNAVWNFLYSISYPNLIELQQKTINRLFLVHLIEENISRTSLPKSKMKNRMRVNPYRSWIRVGVHLCIVLGISIYLYLHINLISFNAILNYIQIRPQVLSLNSDSSINLQLVYNFARELIYKDTEYRLNFIFKDYTLSPAASVQFEKSISLYKADNVEMLHMLNQEELLDKSMMSSLYERYSSDIPYLQLGTYYSKCTYISDIIDISAMDINEHTSKELIDYHEITQKLIDKNIEMGSEIRKTIEEKIEWEFRISVSLMTVFSCFLIFMWWLFVFKVIKNIKIVIASGWTFYNELNLGDLEEVE